MKKTGIVIGIFFTTILTAAFFAPYFFKDKMIVMLKSEINKQTKTKIDFNENIGLSVFKDFPQVSLTISDLIVHAPKGFSSDTLVAFKEIQLSLDLMSVIEGKKIQIHKIILDQPIANFFINKEGKTNWDIFVSNNEQKETKEEKSFDLNLKRLEINNGSIIFKDEVADFSTELKNYNHSLVGDFTQDIFDSKNKVEIEKLSFKKGLISYLNEANIKADAAMNIDLKNKKYTFLKNEFSINGLLLSFGGIINQKKEDIIIDISLNSPEAKFKSFISLIPALYTKDFEDIKADGTVSFLAKAKGTYSKTTIPTFNCIAKAKNAWFQYPKLPNKVDKINFDLAISNKDGKKENTEVRLTNFTATMGKNKTSGELIIKETLADNPYINTKMKLDLKLEELKNYVPMQGNEIIGALQADIKADGRMANVKSGAYEKINASGYLNAQNLKIKSRQLAIPLYLNQVKLSLTPNFAQMPLCIGRIGKNDFRASGKLYNLFSYVFSGKTLKAELNTFSNYLNINELMALTPNSTQITQSNVSKTKQKSQSNEPLFPDKIDFELKSNAKKVKYNKLELTQVKADIQIANQKAVIKKLDFDIWKGSIAMKGILDANNSQNPDLTYTIQAKTISIMNTIKNFEWLQKYIPILDKGLVGDFTTNFTMKTRLDKAFTPDLKTLNLDGVFDIAHVQLSKFTTLKSIENQLNVNEQNNDTTTLKNLLFNLSIKDGNLQVKPMNFKLGDVPINIGGTTGLDSKVNYVGKIELPTKLLKGKQSVVNKLTANTPFKSLKIEETDKLDLALAIGGTVTNPQLKLNLKNIGQSLKEKATDAVKAELESQKNKAIKQAEDKVNQELNKQTEKISEEVNKQTEKIKEKVGEQIRRGLFGN